ncbi:MAG: filamentous hemagglutinin N-terminal domain-containing protein [Desulfamplus sp.]
MNYKQTTLCLSLIFTLILSASPALLFADISTDGSVGAAQTLTGPDYTIPETLGTVKGSNLFHSFDKFSIKTEESATFTGSDSIKNVISRVTGGEKSEIDGTLRSNIGKADFYFINPSGVVFGENAKVDVPAAFHASTADELKFKDGASFKASKSENSTLTQAAPESFGFLGTQSASIEINGSTLEFKPESKVSLTSSKDIAIKGTETKQASLTSYGGEIELTAKGDLLMENATVATTGNGGGKIAVKADNVKLKNNATIAVNNIGDKDSDEGIEVVADKKIEMLNGSLIGSTTWSKGDSGSVKVHAGELTIDGQGFNTGIGSIAKPNSEGNAGNVEITVSGLIQIINGGGITSTTWSKGNAGNVEITVSGSIQIINGAGIGSTTWSKGDAGSVKVNAGELTVDGQGRLSVTGDSITNIGSMSMPSPNSEGSAGRVEITVSGLTQLLNFGVIASNTFSKGDADSVIVNAGKLIIRNGGGIASHTWSKGDSGSVIVNAKELTIDGQGVLIDGAPTTGIGSMAFPNSEGNSGKLEITVSGLTRLINAGAISSSTLSKSDAGTIVVNAGELKMDNNSFISSATVSEGDAGNLTVNAGELTISNGAIIANSTFSKGDAATLVVNAGNLTIDGQGIYSLTGIASIANPNSEGNAGKIAITVSELMHLVNDGRILTSTWSKGDAGKLTVNASHLLLDSSYIQSASSSESAGYPTIYVPNALPSPITGYVGNVAINADSITLLNSSEISIASLQTMSQDKLSKLENMLEEEKPTINLNTKHLTIEGQSQITSASTKNVPASDININADSIYLHDGLITTSVEGTNGDGGNISINDEADPADILVMQNGFIQANSKAKGGTGGRITINADRLLKESDATLEIGGSEIQQFQAGSKRNIIQAAAPEGNPKNDDIKSPTIPIDIGGSIINADSKTAKPVEMTENYCRFIGTKKASRLTRGGRGGIPPMLSEPSSIFITDERLEEFLRYEEQKEKNK